MNELDSQRLSGVLKKGGWESTDDIDEAHMVLLNTCTVRQKPEEKVMSRLGWLKRWKARAPGRWIVVAGCMAQQYGRHLLEKAPYIDLVLGVAQVDQLLEHLNHGEGVAVGLSKTLHYDYQTVDRTLTHKGMVTVIEGCDRFCTFCIVPFTRGRERSRPLRRVLEEVESLVAQGFQEIELLGQTINAYRCPETGASFAELLRKVANIQGLKVVRFITSHPALFTDELIEVIEENPRISRFLHIPPQAGSNKILTRMNRQYTREDYLALVEKIRNKIPEVALSGDMIVGFPGEEEEDFRQTLDLVEKVRFSSLFTFIYSPRPGTLAYRWDDNVPYKVKKARLQQLITLQEAIQANLYRELVGATFPAVVEGVSQRSKQEYQARTSCNRVVNFPSPQPLAPGTWVDLVITEAKAHSLRGRLISKASSAHP